MVPRDDGSYAIAAQMLVRAAELRLATSRRAPRAMLGLGPEVTISAPVENKTTALDLRALRSKERDG